LVPEAVERHLMFRRSSCLSFAIIRLVKRKEKFVAVGINDSDCVVAPPRFLEPQFVDVKSEGAFNVGHEEHGPGVPVMSDTLGSH
jgi:hypothetical protein